MGFVDVWWSALSEVEPSVVDEDCPPDFPAKAFFVVGDLPFATVMVEAAAVGESHDTGNAGHVTDETFRGAAGDVEDCGCYGCQIALLDVGYHGLTGH